MRVGAITGSHPRHDLFVSELSKVVEISGHITVLREQLIPEAPVYLDEDIVLLWQLHFQRRAQAEQRWFGTPKLGDMGPECVVSTLNNEVVQKFVQRMNWDLVLIAGVPIIKEPLFSMLPEWRINLHMGLIPWFKGSITMWWPMWLLRPNWAGCSYHVIDELVDTGQIIHQVKPKLERGMGVHDVASAAYLKACEDVGQVVKFCEQMCADGVGPQIDPSLATKGKTFTKADWHPGMLRTMYELWGDAVVSMYFDGELGITGDPKLVRL